MIEYCIRKRIRKIFRLFFLIILLFPLDNLLAQKGFGIRAGIGNYDLGNAGIQYQVSKRSSFEITGGTNLGLNNNTQWAAGLYFNQVFLKPVVWGIKPGYSVGTVFWTYNDDLYDFKTTTLPISVLLVYPLSHSMMLRVENGIAFSMVAESTRKQNVKAGFPDRIRYAVGLTLIYKFNRNENK